MSWLDVMHATEERQFKMWSKSRMRLRGLHNAKDYINEAARPPPYKGLSRSLYHVFRLSNVKPQTHLSMVL